MASNGCSTEHNGQNGVVMRALTPRLSYADNTFTDVTISCSDGQLSAHKPVLCAVSPVFRRVLSQFRSGEQCAIILLDSTIADVKTMLDMIYFGDQMVSKDNVERVRKLSQTFEIDLTFSSSNSDQNRCDCRSLPLKAIDVNHINSRQTIGTSVPLDLSIASIPLDLSANQCKSDNNQRTAINSSNSIVSISNSTSTAIEKRKRKQLEPKPTRSYVVNGNDSHLHDSGICLTNGLLDSNIVDQNRERLSRSSGSAQNSLCDEFIDRSNSDEELICEVDCVKLENENGENQVVIAEQMSSNMNSNPNAGLAQKEVAKQVSKEDEMDVDCVLCAIDFGSERKLITHMKKVHRNASGDWYECQICHLKIKWAKKFVQHSRSCLNTYSH